MSKHGQKKIIVLQKALKIARDALARIEHGSRDPEGIAQEAQYAIFQVESQARPTPLQGLLGHGKNA